MIVAQHRDTDLDFVHKIFLKINAKECRHIYRVQIVLVGKMTPCWYTVKAGSEIKSHPKQSTLWGLQPSFH